jgi:acyl-coenzyme A synthetase/AMP-(fatty) acid ligase
VSGSNVFGELVSRHIAAGRGARPVFRQSGRSWSYAELEHLSACAAGLLHEAGLRAGDRLLALAGDSVELVAMVLGAFRLGAVAVVGNHLLPAPKLRALCLDSGARAIIASSLSVPHLSTWEQCPAPAGALWYLGEGPPGALPRLEEALAAARPHTPVAEVPGSHPACWQYTRGADGTDLAVVHTHQGMAAGAEPFARARLGMGQDDVIFSVAKLFFGYGFGNSLVFPLLTGACALLSSGRSDVLTVMELVRRERPTLFFGVPTFFASMMKVPDPASRFDVSSVRAFISAGEELGASLATHFQEALGTPLINGLGSTELFHIFMSTSPGQGSPGSLGTPAPGHEVRLLDAGGRPVADGEVGELWVRGPHTGAGYARHPEHTRHVFVDGWVRTGDLLVREASGEFFFRGRRDALIKVAGQKTLISEIERCLLAHEWVLEAQVEVVPDEHRIRELVARIRLREGVGSGTASLRELRTYLRAHLLPHSCPSKIVIVPPTEG